MPTALGAGVGANRLAAKRHFEFGPQQARQGATHARAIVMRVPRAATRELASVSVFETKAAAEESNKTAAE